MNKVKFQRLIFYYCMLLYSEGLGGNDAFMSKDWSSKPLVIYSK